MPTDEATIPVFLSVIRRAYDLLLAGVSPGSIAGTWNAAGLPAGLDGGPGRSGRCGTWTADRVRAVLADPAYAGRLVDEPVWRSATALLSVPRRGPAGSDRALLTAIASCGPCGRPVRSAVVSPAQLAYQCGGDDDRIHLARSSAPIDARVRLEVLERLDRPGTPDPLDHAWDRLAVSRQRGVLLALAERIELHPIPPGRRAGDPDVLRQTVLITWRTP